MPKTTMAMRMMSPSLMRRNNATFIVFHDPVMNDRRYICVPETEAQKIEDGESDIHAVLSTAYKDRVMWDFVEDVMLNEYRMPYQAVKMTMWKLKKHPDILRELYMTLQTGEYPSSGAISVSGQTAQTLGGTSTVITGYIKLMLLSEDESCFKEV